jgi:hypothetical protein
MNDQNRAGRRPTGVFGLCVLAASFAAPMASATNVTTYHFDTLRTGWNQAETTLTPSTVGSSSFGLLSQTALDEQVDAQPLFVAGQTIQGQGTYDVVYVATENNTIYAIDANSGNVLLSQNYGQAVPINALPGGCNNNSNNMGINSTPVIDTAAGLLYAMTYTYENHVPTFRIHALSLSTLQDTMSPPKVTASSTYKNGKPANFLAANNRQRAALLEANGNIYAGFASWCDINSNVSRGWVLGWNAGTLAPLPAAKLMNREQRSPDEFFLTSVWMSGYGIAADASGSLYFITGNTDYDGKDYNSTYNLAESVVKLSPDLTTVQSFFTPRGGPNGWRNFDHYDVDFGSAGALLLPDQPGAYTHLAIAAGKGGPMYLLNRDSLGGLAKGSLTLGEYYNGGCWCGQSYYMGSDGIGRVVSSTGYNVGVWQVQTSASAAPKLSLESQSQGFNNDQDPGFFTSVSSNGTAADSAVVWAVTRPSAGNPDPLGVYLVAIDPANNSQLLYTAEAGTWPFAGNANANLVPVAANGHVFVASYGNLSIFGLTGTPARKIAFRAPPAPVPALYPGVSHELHGMVTAITATTMTLRTRTGSVVQVDVAAAKAAGNLAPPAVGHAALVRGNYDAHGTLVAKFVVHQKDNVGLWESDR